MIQVEATPYPADKKKLIEAWLQLPGCAEFLHYLSHQAAWLTADAGNLLVNLDDSASGREDAEKAAQSVRNLSFIINYLQTVKGQRELKHDPFQEPTEPFDFQGVDLRPMPVLEVSELK